MSKKDIGKSISIDVFYRMIVILINLITGFFITRSMTLDSRGQFNYMITTLGMANVLLNLGFNHSAVYYANKDENKVREYISSNFLVTLIGIIALSIFVFIEPQFNRPETQALKQVFLVCYFFLSYSLILRSLLIGSGNNTYSLKLDVVTRIGFAIYFLYLYFTNNVTVTTLTSYLIFEYLIYCILAWKKLKPKLWPIQISFDFIKENFFFNGKGYLYGVLIVLLSKGDQTIILILLGKAKLALYSTGNAMIENMYIVSTMVSVYFLPKILAMKDYREIIKTSNRIIVLISIISILIATLTYFLCPIITQLHFKKNIPEAILSMRILLIGFVFWSLFVYISHVYLSIRFKKTLLFILTLCTIINLSINYLFLPRYGIVLSAWASSICYFLLFVLTYIDLFYLKKKNFINRINNMANEQE